MEGRPKKKKAAEWEEDRCENREEEEIGMFVHM